MAHRNNDVPKYAYFEEDEVQQSVSLVSSQPQPQPQSFPPQNEYKMEDGQIPPSSSGNYNSDGRSPRRGEGGEYYNQGHPPQMNYNVGGEYHLQNYHPKPSPLNKNQLPYDYYNSNSSIIQPTTSSMPEPFTNSSTQIYPPDHNNLPPSGHYNNPRSIDNSYPSNIPPIPPTQNYSYPSRTPPSHPIGITSQSPPPLPQQYQSPYQPSPSPYQIHATLPNNPDYSTATYSNANLHLTQPYTRTNVQQTHSSPQQQYSASSPRPPSPRHHSQSPVNGPVPSKPEAYSTPQLHSPPSSSSLRPAAAPAPAPIIIAPTYGDKREKRGGGRRKDHHDHDDTYFADCGITLFTYSRTLPSKCSGLCDPNSNNGTLIGNGTSNIQAPSLLSTANSTVNNATSDASHTCSNVSNMLCRVGSSGGRGSGCCYCC
ncbi:3458_t:CDS:2 [Ambispora leptoticha]|uniref:3458_t:CDS:1 n=1 Tax=Ambispora leptoticha TaxID=144679 RepID=A0A9N9GHF0_9GLOM|nr:3458_t:CDS:2 [Ambispora leptoticha]